ncbi:MAG: hypothetical protein ACYC1D_16140 [Acidimicrobiales bacterium]
MIDEYLTVDVLRGHWPDGLPDDELGLPATHHYRLLQRVHQPGTGRLSQILAGLSAAGREAIRGPDPDVVESSTPARCSTRPRGSERATAPAGCCSPRPWPPG